MVHSNAETVEGYLAGLDPERRAVVAAVRETILASLPAGYVEVMRWGMITYEVPLEIFPDTYNEKPLMYCALSAQKRHYAVYLMGCYADPETDARLEAGFREAGTKLDRGKGCVRFRKLEGFPLGVIGEVIASKPLEAFLELYRSTRGAR